MGYTQIVTIGTDEPRLSSELTDNISGEAGEALSLNRGNEYTGASNPFTPSGLCTDETDDASLLELGGSSLL